MENNQPKWLWEGKPVQPEDIPEWAVGFVYEIVDLSNGKQYIGKKSLTSTRKTKIGIRAQQKQKLETGDGRVKKVKRVIKSSGWENYNSSNKVLAEAIKQEPDRYVKRILEWAYSKKNLSYLEMKFMMYWNVLENESYNDNILGKFYRHDTSKQLWEEYQQKQKEKRANKTVSP